ncbi:transcriptional regulator, SARP family [Stackebrandtia nassauensis DSM 44728]|uniref:Transcriptional regulator, SARP family n=2 Tax=Stackebrandtia TaxID=283810 RepID=D3PYU6_STANL|nr:transcriptional regulator, SARP family [Stackebrandtia nassauensis DSM 44728]
MRFVVLGNVEVHGDDGPVAIDAHKQRLLLAVLLSRAGRPIPSDALVETLWHGNPPSAVRKALSWHVLKLREALGDRERVRFRSGGYVLAAEPDEVDARRFERLYREALAGAGSDPRAAARTLARASELWRGNNAYGDLADVGELRDESNRLNELRLAMLDKRYELELALGRHDESVPALRALVAEYPYTEVFRAHLMLALYRGGRRAEALRVYREARELLVGDLGLEPGERLRRLHEDIRASAASLDLGADATAVAAAPIAELPANISTFTGRDGEVTELLEWLRPGDRDSPVTAVVSGGGGVGKSALAVRVAHRLAARYPDGQLYLNLHGNTPDVKPLAHAEALSRVLRSLSVAPPPGGHDVDELAGLFRTATAGQRMLFLFDDARDAAQLRPLLPSGKHCGVIVTSRDPLYSLDDVRHLELEPLGPADSAALFRRLLPGRRLADEPVAADRIVELCASLPLALCIAAARINSRPRWPLADFAERLADSDRRLSELAIDDRAVRASFATSYEDLDAMQSRLFRLSSLLESPDFTVELAAAALDWRAEATEELLDDLVTFHLVDSPTPGRYRMHDLIRLYARERAETDEPAADRDAALRRVFLRLAAATRSALLAVQPLAEWRLAIGLDEDATGPSFADAAEAETWIDAEAQNLIALSKQASRAPDTGAAAVAIAVRTFTALMPRGHWRESVAIAEVAVAAARTAGDPYGLAVALRDLGQAQRAMKLRPEATTTLTEALKVCRDNGFHERVPGILNFLADVHRQEGEYDTAIGLLREGLAACDEHVADERIAIEIKNGLLTSLGFNYEQTGQFDHAAEAHREAIAISHGDPPAHAIALGNLAHVLRRQGEATQAIPLLEEALQLLNDSGNSRTFAAAHKHWVLADASDDLADPARAREHWNLAAEILGELKLITLEEEAGIRSAPRPEMPQPLRF